MKTNDKNNSVKTMLISILIGLGVTFGLLLIFSLLLTIFDLPESVSIILSSVAIIAGAFGCGFSTGYINRKKGLIAGLTSGASFYVIIAIIAVAVTGSGLSTLFLIRLVLSVIFSAIGGIVGLNKALSRKNII